MKVRNRRRRRPDPVAAQIADLRVRAARLGIHFKGERLTAILPQVRCTPEERERAQQLADDAGLSLSEYVRRCATAAPLAVAVAE